MNKKFIFIMILVLFYFGLPLVFAQETSPEFLFKWGTLGNSDGQFGYVFGIASDSLGNIYATDHNNNRIQKFTSGGSFLSKWGSRCVLSTGIDCVDPDGAGPLELGDGQFYSPSAIAIDSEDNIYITDIFNHRIQKFDRNGVFITKWGSFGVGDGQFDRPDAIAMDSSGNIFVSDYKNNRIQKFTNIGTFLAKWGSFGSSDGQFFGPRGITIDATGDVYVADAVNDRIQKFTNSGVFLDKFGTTGSGDGHLDNPYDLIIDSANNIYVSDFNNHRIQKFTNSGLFLVNWGSFGTSDGQFMGPAEMVLNNTLGHLYIADSNNHRIQVFNIPILQSPAISTINQFKSDGLIVISEGEITTESTAIFRVIANDPNNDDIKLQIELKEVSQPFNETNLLESSFISSGNEASIIKEDISDGQYHWRARAVDINGNVSDWQEFGIAGNIDFEVKTVPLYTQVESNFPSLEKTRSWYDKDYAGGGIGTYSCAKYDNATIARCGCAITSSVMILRYYGITTGIDGQDANPKNINDWLNANNGYNSSGNLKWNKVSEYSKSSSTSLARLQFDGIIDSKDADTLNVYTQSLRPVILQHKTLGHFFVADGKLASTYTIKDPAWYNTKNLNDTRVGSYIRNYNNHFDGLRLFSALPASLNNIYLNLASPAEFLIIDSLGRKLGKDPISGIVYNEIPGGVYFQEGISDGTLETPPSPHESKNIWIPEPVEGQYAVNVIGTDTGSYTLDSLTYDTQSQSHSQTITNNTQTALVSEYNLNFTPSQPENINIQFLSESIDECPTLNGNNIGCPAKIDFLSEEKISNSAELPELLGPQGETRYTAPVVEGQRGTIEVKAKLYNETSLLNLLGDPRSIPLDQLCAIFDDTSKDGALANHLIKTADIDGKFSFGVPSLTTNYALIESVREIIAGQSKRVCILETISPRDFDNSGVAFKEVNQISLTVRKTHTGEIIVKKTAGHNSQTISE